VAGLARRQDDTPGTGCRHDCLHRALVQRYRELKDTEAEVRKLAREEATNGQRGTERAEWEAANRQLTFHDYLLDNRGDAHR
jgi:hypothetical protein